MIELNRERPALETRIVGGLVIIILILAFLSLYILPESTAQFFAWTIAPPSTAIIIGVGYLAGALFFLRVLTVKKWSQVQAGFLPITVFTAMMMAATFIHWDRFHQGTFIFYLWTGVYAITPFLVPFLWWRNRAKNPGLAEEHDLVFSQTARRVLFALGGAGILLGLAGFIWPAIFISLCPWKLTELTARVFSGWSLLTFTAILTIARAGRWSAARLLVQSAMFAQALTLIALPRMWKDFDPANPLSYVVVGGLVLVLIGSLVLHLTLDRKSRAG